MFVDHNLVTVVSLIRDERVYLGDNKLRSWNCVADRRKRWLVMKARSGLLLQAARRNCSGQAQAIEPGRLTPMAGTGLTPV